MKEINRAKIIDIETAMLELKEKKNKLTTLKKEIEVKNAQYNARIRTANRKLPPDEYKNICREQSNCKSKIIKLDEKIKEINIEMSKKGILKERLKLELSYLINTEIDVLTIRAMLIKMRDDYISFASDNTRVSSMRIMASQIAEEIEYIIKKI